MKPENIDYTLYLVTDRGLSRERTTQHIVEAALRGGVTCVQLREKTCSSRDFIAQALSIKDHLKRHNVPLIINDRVDIAQAVNADGVHLGQSDMPIGMAKAIIKDSMIIGISAESIKDAVQAEKDGADYIGVGTIYPTPTKTDTSPPLGPEGLREIRKSVKIPRRILWSRVGPSAKQPPPSAAWPVIFRFYWLGLCAIPTTLFSICLC